MALLAILLRGLGGAEAAAHADRSQLHHGTPSTCYVGGHLLPGLSFLVDFALHMLYSAVLQSAASPLSSSLQRCLWPTSGEICCAGKLVVVPGCVTHAHACSCMACGVLPCKLEYCLIPIDLLKRVLRGQHIRLDNP